MTELVPRADRSRAPRQGSRSEFHRRCRGSGPARTVAGRDRGRVRRRFAKGWDGFGLAIQAYQKRAGAVIDYIDELARALNRRMMVRLVKGAYWDTEIKRAQERGLDDYPVFTRKAMTDLNYIACAQQLLALRPRLFPQFATHNALTVATRSRTAGRRRADSSSSACMAWARRSTRNLSEDRPAIGLPHLCAGRQPSRSAGLSGAAPAGERRQLVVRGGRRRRYRAGRNAAAAPGRNHR